MSIASQVQSLATRIGTEFKAVYGQIGPLGSLSTTAKNNLISAINEVKATADSAASSGGAKTLDDLIDVVNTSPATGHIIRHNGTNYVNVLGTTHYEVAGAAAAAQSASQPKDPDLDALAALTTTAYGRNFNTLADQAALMALVRLATTSVSGISLLSTVAQGQTGTDTTTSMTPASTKAAIDQRIINDATLAGNSTTNAPSVASVKAYADGRIAAQDAFVARGGLDLSTNPNYPAGNAGDTYRVTVAGRIGGAAGPTAEVGDIIQCWVDGSATGTHAAVGANWNVIQTNIDGAVTGPTTVVSGDVAIFSGTSGKLIADGPGISTDATMASNSNALLPTQAAVRGYAQPLDGELTALAGLTSAADRLPYFSGAGTAALATFTAFGRTLVSSADNAAARTSLDVYNKADIGDPATDFVATFNAALL